MYPEEFMSEEYVERIRKGVRRGLLSVYNDKHSEFRVPEDEFNLITERVVKEVCLALV